MKNLLLTFSLIMLFGAGGFGQSKMDCCSGSDAPCKQSANAQFAALGNESGFAGAHESPTAYRHITDAGKAIEFDTDGKPGKGFYYGAGSDKYLFVFHEWWGLNGHIKKEAEEFFNKLDDVNVLCIDLYDGKVADTPKGAKKLMQNASEDRMKSIIHGAIDFAGEDARVASIGWCFGGGWSLQSAIMLGNNAEGCVMYYGMPEKDVSRLKKLQCPVLGFFAKKDDWINPKVVGQFEENMEKAGKELETHSYQADHAFANPSNPSYNKEAAKAAYGMTLPFLKQTLDAQ